MVVVGFIAGIIDTVTGGGSNLILPTFNMMMAMPADIANAANLIAISPQYLV
ncbi:MAG: putative membrane protein YfcA [Cellvibrionaceae bacterium]